jgi:hypothetical protein
MLWATRRFLAGEGDAALGRERRRAHTLLAGAFFLSGVMASRSNAVALDSETFDDFKGVGAADDARERPAALSVDGHTLEPSLNYKIFDFLTPHVFGAETAGYSDNVLLTPAPSEHSPFEKTTAGVRGDVQLEDNVFSLGYRASGTDYFNLTQSGWLFEQQADSRIDLNFNSFQFHADALYGRYAYPGAIQVVGLAPEQVYQAQTWTYVTWNRFGAKVGASWRRDDFEHTGSAFELRGDNKDTLGVDLQVNFEIFERLRALAEYDFENDRFDLHINRDWNAHQGRVGVDGSLTEKLSVSLKVGYTYQQPYGSASFEDSSRYSGFDAAASASWQLVPNVTLSAAYRHDLTWAVGANYEQEDSIELGGTYKFGPEDKIGLHLGFTWSRASPDTGDHFDRVLCLASLAYPIQKWLDVFISYQYSQGLGNGTFVASQYDEHRVAVSIAVGF